jgi:hypothetical protein
MKRLLTITLVILLFLYSLSACNNAEEQNNKVEIEIKESNEEYELSEEYKKIHNATIIYQEISTRVKKFEAEGISSVDEYFNALDELLESVIILENLYLEYPDSQFTSGDLANNVKKNIESKKKRLSNKIVTATPKITTNPTPKPTPLPTPAPTKLWYQGGTLHDKTIYDWKQATYSNKLATCADFIAASKDNLNIDITTVDSIKPFAEQLVICMDTAIDGGESFDEQSVSEMAIISMAFLEWYE